MTLDQFRPHVQGIVQPVVDLARRLGLNDALHMRPELVKCHALKPR